MTHEQIIALIAVLVVALVAIAIFARRRGHVAHLEHAFGSEYRRVVHELGSERAARHELERRQERVARLHIHELPREQAAQFQREWTATQSQFVDDPNGAIARANALVREVMTARGYPMNDFQARVADLSVDHAKFLESYREAHEIAMKSADGSANTEELRRAMVDYRAMFLDLLGEEPGRAAPKPTFESQRAGQRRLRHAT